MPTQLRRSTAGAIKLALQVMIDDYYINMIGIWYPGRPPLCSQELAELLTKYADAILEIAAAESGEYIDKAERIGSDLLQVLMNENEEALGTDDTLNKFLDFILLSFDALQQLPQNQAWTALGVTAAEILAVRNQLQEEMKKHGFRSHNE